MKMNLKIIIFKLKMKQIQNFYNKKIKLQIKNKFKFKVIILFNNIFYKKQNSYLMVYYLIKMMKKM